LIIATTASALVSMMFLLMVRMNDPLMPRAMFGVLNTLLYFPSGAVYPQQAFPGWLRAIASVDPFSYAVHAFKCVLLKDTGFAAILPDLGFLWLFALVSMTFATMLFRRTL
jgi:ABC-2 type transport system permease protein